MRDGDRINLKQSDLFKHQLQQFEGYKKRFFIYEVPGVLNVSFLLFLIVFLLCSVVTKRSLILH